MREVNSLRKWEWEWECVSMDSYTSVLMIGRERGREGCVLCIYI